MVFLSSKDILAARRAGDRMARRAGAAGDGDASALCRNACLLAAALRDGEGKPVYRNGGDVLVDMSPKRTLERLDGLFFGGGGNPAFDEERFSELSGGEGGVR